jgi:DNA polymerase-1
VAAAIGPARAARLAEAASRAAWELNCQVMAMHPHVGVDLTGDVGALPLPTEAVRATYAGQDLHWTAAAALRALARDGSGPVAPAVEPSWAPRPARRTHPPLPARRPSDQLALF